jgi:lysophospholipase L1-like esterase
MRISLLFVFGLSFATAFADRPLVQKPADPYFSKFQPEQAPPPAGLLLKAGDRLAICGDSITEQKMYSRIMETYLTACVPQFGVTTRQYGWSGETANGFLGRMKNDCLRFSPTIVTTCYGMNDHQYKPFEERIGESYGEKQTAIVEEFKKTGARVILGSAGCVGKVPSWVKTATGTVEDLNVSLCHLRNIDIAISEKEHVAFADVFWPMLSGGFAARQQYGPEYAIEGHDGVHPNWAGHTVMAYAFLKAMGLDGDIGTLTVDLKSGTAIASPGHEVLGYQNGELRVKSSRYPFCAAGGDPAKDDNIRSGMARVPFNQDLNRLMFFVKNATAAKYQVSWGTETHSYTPAALAAGVNLAADFPDNPFLQDFKRVDAAVAAKQNYETKEIKQIFHELLGGRFKSADDIKDPEMKELFALRDSAGNLDREAIVKASESKRAPLAEAIKAAFVPVTHTIRIAEEK